MLNTFYRAVLPDAGQFCLFLLPEAHHVWADSIDDLVELTHKYQDRAGVYFGTSAFKTTDNRKQANVLALRALRLDIDAGPEKLAKHGIDAVYATQQDALADSIRFFKATKLLPSYIVSSGAGLHIYFCFDQDLTPEQWLPLAKALSFKGIQQDYKIDPSVTEDSARILRPVGSVHHFGPAGWADDGEVRVKVLKATGKTYGYAEMSELLGAQAPTRKYDTSINDDAISKVEGPPSSAFKIAEKCGALREVVDAGGAVPEPFWRAMLGLVKFTIEGDDAAHEWSQGYDDYDSEATTRKLNAWATGPSTCTEFAKHTTACSTCEHQGKVKSPILLGRMTVVEVADLPDEIRPEPVTFVEPPPTGKPWDGRIPKGFSVTPNKDGFTLIHSQKVKQNDEVAGGMVESIVDTQVTHEIFWFSHWADAEHSGDAAQVVVHKYDDMEHRIKAYIIPIALLASRMDFAKKLGEIGIHLTTDKRAQASMETFAKEQFQRIKNLSRRIKVTDRFGLRILDNGTLVAVHGDKVIYPDGTLQEAMIGPLLRGTVDWYSIPVPKSFSGDWDASVWETHIDPAAHKHVAFMRKHYRHEGMAKYQLAFMLGLASPFMAFVTGGYTEGTALPPNGLSVSLFEKEGGKGKTTLMHAVSLAYGSPENLSKDQNDNGATNLARITKLSMWGTMPACFDEMGRTGEKSAAGLISAVANGTSRERLTKEGALTTSPKWALICLVATNRSQRDMVTVGEGESSAVQYRMLELDMNNMPDFDVDSRMAFARDWATVKRQVAGALGAVIQREICAMGVEKVNELVMSCVDRAARVIVSDKEDRFQYRALGAMMALHVILKKLGMDMFNLKDMVAEFNVANESAKEYILENTLPTDGLELLSRALHDMRANTVVTETHGEGRGRVAHYARAIGNHLPNQVDARFVIDTGMLYVSVEALRKWCAQKHVRDTEMIVAARAALVLRPIYESRVSKTDILKFPANDKINLLRGMQESTNVLVKCYAFNVNRLALKVGPELTSALNQENVVPIRPPERSVA
jgi:hypothetical protein